MASADTVSVNETTRNDILLHDTLLLHSELNRGTGNEKRIHRILYLAEGAGLPRMEISQLPQCLLSFFAATTITRAVTWQMFATVTQSNKVRTSRYWYMLSIIY